MIYYEHNGILYERWKVGNYKYRMLRDYSILTPYLLEHPIETDYFSLVKGRLTAKVGYAWDGPSGLSIDTKTFRRGSLVHDLPYQMCRERYLDYKIHRYIADRMMQQVCIEDGMWKIRAAWCYQAVHLFGEKHARPQ